MSDEWLAKMKQDPLAAGAVWLESIEVPVTTLDLLAARYGIPRFVKIDVEGFEEEVLAGMTFRPDYLSFEFHTTTPYATTRCLARLQGYEFNAAHGWTLSLLHPNWVAAEQILRSCRPQQNGAAGFGDIFARRASPASTL